MLRKSNWLLVLVCTGLFFTTQPGSQAQQQTTPPPQPQQPAAEPEQELKAAAIEPPPDAAEDTDLILADIDEDADDAQRSGRFIPTEEISQDLGVSFPVDI